MPYHHCSFQQSSVSFAFILKTSLQPSYCTMMANSFCYLNSQPARWCSGESVRIVVGRPGVHSLNRVIPKDFKKMVFTTFLLGAQHKKGMVWRTSRQACLLCPWSRYLTGRLHLYVADSGPPVLHRVTIVKLPTQHVVKDDSWVPTSGSPPCWWWGYQSLKTGSKWAAIFPLA